jgi:hypothetical protein
MTHQTRFQSLRPKSSTWQTRETTWSVSVKRKRLRCKKSTASGKWKKNQPKHSDKSTSPSSKKLNSIKRSLLSNSNISERTQSCCPICSAKSPRRNSCSRRSSRQLKKRWLELNVRIPTCGSRSQIWRKKWNGRSDWLCRLSLRGDNSRNC